MADNIYYHSLTSKRLTLRQSFVCLSVRLAAGRLFVALRMTE